MKAFLTDFSQVAALTDTKIEGDYIKISDIKEFVFTGFSMNGLVDSKVMFSCKGCPCTYQFDYVEAFLKFCDSLNIDYSIILPKKLGPMYVVLEDFKEIFFAVAPRTKDIFGEILEGVKQ